MWRETRAGAFKGGTVYPPYHSFEGWCSPRCFGPRTEPIRCCGNQCFRRWYGGRCFAGHIGLQTSMRTAAWWPQRQPNWQTEKTQAAPKSKETKRSGKQRDSRMTYLPPASSPSPSPHPPPLPRHLNRQMPRTPSLTNLTLMAEATGS